MKNLGSKLFLGIKRFTLKPLLMVVSFCIIGLSTSFISCKYTSELDTTAKTGGDAVMLGSEEFSSEIIKPDHKTYSDKSGKLIYEVKYKSDGFNVLDASSDLLWKISHYKNKIIISDNEANENSWEIKILSASRAKLVKGETVLAFVENDHISGKPTIHYNGGTDILEKESNYSATYLLETLNDIPEDQQEVIIFELKAKHY